MVKFLRVNFSGNSLVLLLFAVSQCFAAIEDSSTREIVSQDGKTDGYPVIFEPTEEWQEVRQDQVIPGGLHVRMNLETGTKEAKLLSDNDVDSMGLTAVIVNDSKSDAQVDSSHQEAEEQGGDFAEDWESTYSHKPNPHITLLEHQEFDNNLAFVLSSFSFDKSVPEPESTPVGSTTLPSVYEDETDDALLLSSLRTLEDFAHEIDFGIKLAEPEALSVFMRLLGSHPSPTVRALCAQIIGSSLRNNSPALYIAMPAQVVTNLLASLDKENDAIVRVRIMFALGSAIHGRLGRKEFWSRQGGVTLRKYFSLSEPDEDYMARCGTFVEDSFVNDMMNVRGSSDVSETDLATEMGLWCSSFQDALALDIIESLDAKEKMFSALSAIKSKYSAHCPVQDSFRSWIARKIEERTSIRNQIRTAEPAARNKLSAIGNAQGAGSDRRDLMFLDKLSDARHALFGNPKAARKTMDYHDEF